MKLTRTTHRLAARTRTRQLLVHARADAAAFAADRAVREIWRHVLALLRTAVSWPQAQRDAGILLTGLFTHVNRAIALPLLDIAAWGFRSTVRTIGATVPKRQLLRAATQTLREDDSAAPELRITELLDILFPPPPEADVLRIVYGNQWQERLAASTRLAQPATLASIIANGMIQGKSQQEIARDILPAVNNVRVSARRIARTEALRVAGQMQMQAHEALGDLVIAYQVHSMHDEHVRPWHLKRDKTIYYKNSAPGQKGLEQLPNPPEEAADPNERPPGTPQMAWNCRCYITPILRP